MSDNGNNLPDKAPASTLSERVRSLRLTDADATPEAASWWRWLPWSEMR